MTTETKAPARRGTTNGNARRGSDDRRRRREWLVATYRANRDLLLLEWAHTSAWPVDVEVGTPGAVPACRCYRCGLLMTADTLTVDRIVPGCRGGTYARSNIRPSCQPCASYTGAVIGNERKRARSKRL